MLFKHQNYIVLLFLVFLFSSYQRVEFKQEAKVGYGRINISFAGYSHDTLLLKTAYLNRVDSIFLDSSGFGSFDLPIDQPTFTFLVDPNYPNPTKLLIDDGFEMTIVKENDSLKFYGKGSDVNLYLNRLTNYESELSIHLQTIKNNGWESSQRITNTYHLLDSMLHEFSSRNKVNSSNDFVNSLVLIESLIHAKWLVFSELFYYRLNEGHQIISSDLETLGVTNLLKNDSLFTSSSHNLYNLLTVYNNYLLREAFLENSVELNELELFNMKRIAESFELAKSIKEYLMYHNIYLSISHHGVTEKTFEAVLFFETHFNNSIYKEKLYNLVNQFNRLRKGKQAYNISFQNLLGDQISLDNFIDKFIFIDVWASWCGPCIKKIPEIESVLKSFPEIQFIFLNIEPEEAWRKYIKRVDSNLLKHHFNLTSNDFRFKYKLSHVPRYILIDKSGKIVDAFYNFKDSESLILLFNDILK